jgi:hypothetical protein
VRCDVDAAIPLPTGPNDAASRNSGQGTSA